MPSQMQAPLPKPASAPIRPAIAKTTVKLGPTTTSTRDMFRSVVSAQARISKTTPSDGWVPTQQVAAPLPPPPPPA
eukprot:11187151-Lingulodinium_polyedra.AAC.1